MHSNQRRSSAFTLVELLVVIAIVAVLIAMILPSIAVAREHARRIVCLNNEHQASVLLLAYAIDNKTLFPSGIRLRGSYNGAGVAFDPHPRDVPASTYQWMTNATGSAKLFMCPNTSLYSAKYGNTGLPAYDSTYNSGWYIGYLYLGGHTPPAVTASNVWVAPKNADDTPTLGLWADPTERGDGVPTANGGPHGRADYAAGTSVAGVGQEPAQYALEGTNVATVDGAAAFKRTALLTRYNIYYLINYNGTRTWNTGWYGYW